MNFREVDMKQYGLIDPTYYVASNDFFRQKKISDSNQLMCPQSWVPGMENPQEMPVWEIRTDVISHRMFCEIDINHAKLYRFVLH